MLISHCFINRIWGLVPWGAKSAVCVGVLALAGCGGGGAGVQSHPADLSLTTSSVSIDAMTALTNSADAYQVSQPVTVHNSTNQALSVSAYASAPAIAAVSISQDPLAVVLTPLSVGTTSVTVTATAGTASASTTFEFTVSIVSKSISVAMAAPDQSAIQVANTSDRLLILGFAHNEFPVFASRQDIVTCVRQMPSAYAGEPFERKLWRFLVATTYHGLPLSAALWINDPWVTVNSLGWAVCSQGAAAYVEIAAQAGYTARIWAIGGHVVPEVLVDGVWHMYDPDLAVYYYDSSGAVASVDALVAEPSLITQPLNPIFPDRVGTLMYSQTIADIYASTVDNGLAYGWLVPTTPPPSGQLWLPPGATLTYPGHWTPAPAATEGGSAYPVTYFKQARMDIPAGWTGTISLPWQPWDIQGTGTVVINGVSLVAGDPTTTATLQASSTIPNSLQVQSSGGVAVIFFVNALKFGVALQNTVSVSGLDVSGVRALAITLPAAYLLGDGQLQPGQAKPQSF